MQGLIRRVRTAKDRRVVKIELTEAGLAMAIRSPKIVQGMLATGLEELSPEKLEAIATSLRDLVGILRARKISPRLMVPPEAVAPVVPEKELGGPGADASAVAP